MNGILILVGFTCVASNPAPASIGIVAMLGDEFGCYYVDPNLKEQALMFADYGSSGRAKISDKEVRLELTFSNAMNAKKAGDRVSEKFKGGNATFDYVGSFVSKCEPEGNPCNFSRGTLTISFGNTKESGPEVTLEDNLGLPPPREL